MKCSLGISNFLEEISSLSYSVVFLYFFRGSQVQSLVGKLRSHMPHIMAKMFTFSPLSCSTTGLMFSL